jgi:hypothetical protein
MIPLFHTKKQIVKSFFIVAKIMSCVKNSKKEIFLTEDSFFSHSREKTPQENCFELGKIVRASIEIVSLCLENLTPSLIKIKKITKKLCSSRYSK